MKGPILFVEDDEMHARTFIDYLGRAGYQIIHFSFGRDAIARIKDGLE